MNAKSSEFRAESLESVQKLDSVVVAVHDTIMETTTITYVLRQAQEPDEPEDTVKVTTVTDRLRSRDRDAIARQKTKTEVVRDTVYVQRDSVIVKEVAANGDQSGKTTLHSTLKWLFWVIMAMIGLVITVKIFGR